MNRTYSGLFGASKSICLGADRLLFVWFLRPCSRLKKDAWSQTQNDGNTRISPA